MSEQAGAQRQIVGRYALGDLLGRGGMGTVWRAQDELLGRAVAIKAVEIPDAVSDGERASMRARVLREARAAARLNHPGVITIHDIVEEGGRVFIVMELVVAPTLAAAVAAHGPLAPARVARIGQQLLDALEVAHGEGIVHRDIKPANVMLLPRDRVKLADFGIASVQGDPQLTSSGVVLGSPAFMAPEQVSGEPSGPPADLWALGATMYHAVEGRVPFQRDTQSGVLVAILAQDADPLELAGPLSPVIAGLLAKAPEDRPSAERLHQLLEQVAASESDSVEVAVPPLAAPPAAPLAAPPTAAVDGGIAPTTLGADIAAATPRVGVAGTPAGTPVDAAAGAGGSKRPSPPNRRLLVGGGVAAVLAVAVLALVLALVRPAAREGQQGSGVTTTIGDGGAATEQGQPSATTTARYAGQASSATTVTGSQPSQADLQLTEVAPAGQTLPNGSWRSATNQDGGYRIGVPSDSWVATAEGPATFVGWPSDATFNAAFEVYSYGSAEDPYKLLQRDAAAFATNHAQDQYKRVRLTKNWTYKRKPAAAWEFTWMLNGELTRARVVAFRWGSHTYEILYRSKDLWWYDGGSSAFPIGFELAFTPLP